MVCIDRCICTGRSFADLLEAATLRCVTLPDLIAETGAGNQCTRCLPYLRRCMRTGQTQFSELLAAEDEPETSLPPLPAPHGKVVLSWSGGKDSAMALHRLLADPDYEVVGLLTTVSRDYQRVSHHGVREELIEFQAAQLGLPLEKVYFPPTPDAPATMEAFDDHMGTVLRRYRERGIFLIAHGDIYLEDLRTYRLRRLRSVGMDGVFPLWGEDPELLLQRFCDDGFRARLTCVEPELGAAFAGADLDADLRRRFPSGIDPCGERGEYHSFVYDGPIFRTPIPITSGATVERDRRFYTDLLLTR